jgi:hypothetical protein
MLTIAINSGVLATFTVVVGSGSADIVDGPEMGMQVVAILETIADDSNKVAVGSASSVLTAAAIVADEVLRRQGPADITATNAVRRAKVTRIVDDSEQQLNKRMVGLNGRLPQGYKTSSQEEKKGRVGTYLELKLQERKY